jgi:hypothetical protein
MYVARIFISRVDGTPVEALDVVQLDLNDLVRLLSHLTRSTYAIEHPVAAWIAGRSGANS